jgi:hypothetical protein
MESAVNILNKQPRTAEKGWSSNLSVGGQLTTPRRKKKKEKTCKEMLINKILVGKPKGKRPPGRRRRRWEDNIRTDLKEIGWESFD